MLRLGDANFENSLEELDVAVVVCGPAGVIRFVSRHTESLFGYRRDNMVGQRIEMLVPESRREVNTALRAGYFADPFFRPPGLGPERTGRRRDGTEFPVDFSVLHIETQDGPLAIAAVRDLTGLKRPDGQAAGVEYSADAPRIESARWPRSWGRSALVWLPRTTRPVASERMGRPSRSR